MIKTMDNGERGINPVAMTFVNPGREYWPSRGSNQQPPVLKACMLPTLLWGWALNFNTLQEELQNIEREKNACNCHFFLPTLCLLCSCPI